MELDLQELLARRQQIVESLESAIKTRNQMEGKMQSRYDTQREEWALQCDILEGQVHEMDKLIKQLESISLPSGIKTMGTSVTTEIESDAVSASDAIRIGSKIVISINDAEPEKYILLLESGGHSVSDFVTLSAQSPVGAALIGKRKGDRIDIAWQEQKKTRGVSTPVRFDVVVTIIDVAPNSSVHAETEKP